eukprot:SAG31_NODE_1178_length_9531_cov_3.040818_2_plen_56_part_00
MCVAAVDLGGAAGGGGRGSCVALLCTTNFTYQHVYCRSACSSQIVLFSTKFSRSR